MLNSITTNLLTNVLPCSFIIGVTIWAIWTELKSFSSYKNNDCAIAQRAIKFLEDSDRSKKSVSILTQEVGTEAIEWFFNHFDGKRDRVGFTVHIQDGYFILLSYPSILSRAVPKSPVYFAPTLLTALGIFGTFLGISIGIGGIELDRIQDPQQLVSVSSSLLSGMKLAFLTSLLGLFGAIPLMFLLAYNAKRKEKYRDKLRKRLASLAFLETSERLLSRFDRNPDDSAVRVLEKIGEKLGYLNNFSPDAIANAIQKAIASEDSLLVHEVRNIKLLQQTQGQTVESLVRQLRSELIEPVVERLDQSANLTQEASSAVRELKNELGGISRSLSESVQTIQIFQQNTLKELQQFADSLQTILKGFQQETKGVLEQVGVEINQAVSESISGMKSQREAFAESANTASQTFRGIREDLQAALQSQSAQQKEMLLGVEAQTKSILQEAATTFEAQSDTLKTVGVEASELMNGAKDNLLGSLNNIDIMLQNTRQTVQEELENFRTEYQLALTEFFNEQNNLLNETLGEQRQGLGRVVTDLQNTFSDEIKKRQAMTAEVDNTLIKIGQTVKNVSDLASAIGMNSSERLGQLQELARTIGSEAHRVENSYQNMTKEFNKALDLGNKQLFDYLQKVNESYVRNIEQTDLATAEVCGKLNETSYGLASVADYLVAAAKTLESSNGRN